MYEYDNGYHDGADSNIPIYYCNGESEEYVNGFIDGREVLYSRVEDDNGKVYSSQGLSILAANLPLWETVRELEKMED